MPHPAYVGDRARWGCCGALVGVPHARGCPTRPGGERLGPALPPCAHHREWGRIVGHDWCGECVREAHGG